ncbi:hypothetical protein Bca52824_010760 [Brassica carinata]|uniref:Uncharacterized protein n=1 Tax=Brassica carinata TaxID=52824 RepID=A0A8X8BBJ5_BRACI|nr:hypothetical protein Bca52824_010760 [Brassica carinata]
MKHTEDKTSRKETHANTEARRMTLSDGETKPPPPMNNPPSSTALPAVTEEIASFNTAQETAPSEESDERYETSIREPDLPKEVTGTEDKPVEADPEDLMVSSPHSSPATQLEADNQETIDESPLPLVVATQAKNNSDERNDSEAESESAQKVDESKQNQEIVAVTSSPEAATVKEGRKKRPEDAAKSPFLAKEAGVLARVRSKKSDGQSTEAMPSPLKKRYDQFLKRKVIAERMVDMKEADQWGYLAVIKKGSMESTVSSLGVYVEQVVAEFA